MSLFRTFVLSVFALSLVACSGDEENKYSGPRPLSGDQKVTAGSAVSKLGQVERAVKFIDGTFEELDKDVEGLVLLIQAQCEIDKIPKGDENNGSMIVVVYGGSCPVAINSKTVWSSIPLDGELYFDITYEIDYEALDNSVLSMVDLKSLSMVASQPAGSLPSFKATLDIVSIGTIKIDDKFIVKQTSNDIIESTYLRKMRVNNFLVEARVIFVFRIEPGEGGDELVPIDLNMFINGERANAEEMSAIFPDAFGRFDGKSLNSISQRNYKTNP